MPRYFFSAWQGGQPVKGFIEADDHRRAARLLTQSGYIVTDVFPAANKPDIFRQKPARLKFLPEILPRNLAGWRPSALRMVIFFRQLAALICSGLATNDALRIIADEAAADRQSGEAAFLREMAGELEAGGTLSRSIAQRPNIFPSLAVALIAAGEAGGALDETLAALAEFLEASRELRERLITVMIYPALTLFVSVAVLVLLAAFVLPVFASLLAEIGGELPIATRLILAGSDFLIDYLWLIVPIALLFAIIFICLWRNGRWRRIVERTFFRLPILGRLAVDTLSAQTATALAALVAGGVTLNRALVAAADVPLSAEYSAALHRAARATEQGQPFSIAIRADGRNCFSPLFAAMMVIGDRTGDLVAALKQASYACRQAADARRKRIEALIEPLLLLFVGGIVAFVVLSAAIPLLDTLTMIK